MVERLISDFNNLLPKFFKARAVIFMWAFRYAQVGTENHLEQYVSLGFVYRIARDK